MTVRRFRVYKEAPGLPPVPRERDMRVYKDAPGFRHGPVRERCFRAYKEAPGLPPGPRESERKGDAPGFQRVWRCAACRPALL